MAKISDFEENYYGFRSVDAGYRARLELLDEYAALAPIAEIEAYLQAAHLAYFARQYETAIELYLVAWNLLTGLADPASGKSGNTPIADALSFDVILSACLEHLSYVTMPKPGTRAQPRVTPDVPQPSQRSGFFSSPLATVTQAQAAADWRLAMEYRERGLTNSARFFLDRARSVAPDTVSALEAERAVTHSTSAWPPLWSAIGRRVAGAFGLGPRRPEVRDLARSYELNLPSGFQQVTIAWDQDADPPLAAVREAMYESRVVTASLDELIAGRDTDDFWSGVLLTKPHNYFFDIPVGLAQCHHALGDFPTAEAYYFKVIGYLYLNRPIEGRYLWRYLARLYLDWGNALYRNAQVNQALEKYTQVLDPAGNLPDSRLYREEALASGAEVAREVIANLETIGVALEIVQAQRAGQARDEVLQERRIAARVADLVERNRITSDQDLLAVEQLAGTLNPDIIDVIKQVHQQLLKIGANLDYWGGAADLIPVHTFDYLQRAALTLAQQAVSAERDMIAYLDRFDQERMTAQQLDQALGNAHQEWVVAHNQRTAAKAQEQAVYTGWQLAVQRATNARFQLADYENYSSQWVTYQALASQMAGSGYASLDDLNNIVGDILAGRPAYLEAESEWEVGGSPWRESVAAALQLMSGKARREYELRSMDRQIAESQTAAEQAGHEYQAAQARTAVATAAVDAAAARIGYAYENVLGFDNQFFTPDVWYEMGLTMERLYHGYLDMGLEVAQLMQRAYNFEHDTDLDLIRSTYSTGPGTVTIESKLASGQQLVAAAAGETQLPSQTIGGILGAEQLTADIHSFTHHRITSSGGKPQPLKQTISLAQRYPYLFESQFRPTGRMAFETRIEDFDEHYPGSYAGRIEAMEVEVDGIVPVRGISGTLTNHGISGYRTPAALWTDPEGSGLKYRIQPRETLVLSDYRTRTDALLMPPDQRLLRVFEGAGLASSWTLDLPKAINDIHFPSVTDVRITFYYQARFDPELAALVRQRLATLPGGHGRQRGLPLRWLFPDAFFHFMDHGELRFSLRGLDFPVNEQAPMLTDIGVLVIDEQGGKGAGIELGLSTPTRDAVTATTDAEGAISSDAYDPWRALAEGTALGDYAVIVADAQQRAAIGNIALIISYDFTPPA